jgi:uncharacterized protein
MISAFVSSINSKVQAGTSFFAAGRRSCVAGIDPVGLPGMNEPVLVSVLAEQLCPACGICCNGVLFKDVELQRGDDAARLQTLGQPLARRRGRTRFAQPCAALGLDGRCRLYPERPARCRDFECALFTAVQSGKAEMASARRAIRAALECANRVRVLLRELGDTNERLALSLRFRKMKKQLEAGCADEAIAETYSQLTLAVHDLNIVLRRDFYPV